MEYKGYVYAPEQDVEPEENVKIIHFVKTPDGNTIQFDWSPYNTPTPEDFALWIELGCPGRIEEGRSATFPLDRNDLLELNTQKRQEEV